MVTWVRLKAEGAVWLIAVVNLDVAVAARFEYESFAWDLPVGGVCTRLKVGAALAHKQRVREVASSDAWR